MARRGVGLTVGVAVVGLFGINVSAAAGTAPELPAADGSVTPTEPGSGGPAQTPTPSPTDQIIVSFSAEARVRPEAVEAELSSAAGISLQTGQSLGDGSVVMALPGALPYAEVAAIAGRVASSPGVASAEPDAIMQVAVAPTDPRYYQQWHYRWVNTNGWGANLEPAWSITTGGPVTVAVIDTGRRDHVDLAGKLLDGVDMITHAARARDGGGRDNNETDMGNYVTADLCPSISPPTNSNWHGTHVAGTIAAVANNGQGGAGVSWGAKVLHVRVLGACGGLTSDLSDGVRWAAGQSIPGVANNQTPAKIINMSLSSAGPCSTTLQGAIDYAISRGAIIVVSAGNNAANVADFQPANCNNVLVVASGNRQGFLASYSNRGPAVDLVAPGGEATSGGADAVLSTVNTGTTAPADDNGYAFYSGTSMAAPHVAGVLALMKTVSPSSSASQLQAALVNNVRPFRSGGVCTAITRPCGFGWLDAGRVLTAMTGTTTPSLTVADVTVNEGNSGTKNMTFRLILSAASTSTVSVRVATAPGTATAPADFTAKALTTVTFTPGQTSKAVSVTVKGDTALEADEFFRLDLSNPVNLTLADVYAVGTIRNDD